MVDLVEEEYHLVVGLAAYLDQREVSQMGDVEEVEAHASCQKVVVDAKVEEVPSKQQQAAVWGLEIATLAVAAVPS